MPEIGATLRDARMRARIDIAEIEQATKIRAKYLRALENEEWELLPGPTFVKTFLRTYAEALGLDAKLLVDEYKLRHERLADSELRPIAPRSTPSTGRSSRGPGGLPRGGGGGPGRGAIVLALVLALFAVIYLIGALNNDDGDPVSTRPDSTTSTGSTPRSAPKQPSSGTAPVEEEPKPERKLATLRVLPTGNVNVCLRAEGQGALINGVDLREGETQKTYRSSRFTLTLGNNNARIRFNGKTFRPPASSTPIGYTFTPSGMRRLKADELPTCG
ncbi:MAG: helix-turn-helix domain-containing protein [Solirubrobacterales bacterium]|nr:helix-turn-helix domain-containing protein [Solirubrobacterales bacterium]